VPIDIFDTERPAPDRVFRYPLHERWLWIVVVVVVALGVVFFGHIQEFMSAEGQRALAVLGVVVFFLLMTIWVSLRAWISKVVLSPVSLKARVFGQGVQRISWVHIQAVVYKWRPLGHKLIFIGSDGAKVTFRSSIRGYDQLLGFIRESAPPHVRDQLDDILGEEEEEIEDEVVEEQPSQQETPQPEPAGPAAPDAEPLEPEGPPEAEPETRDTEPPGAVDAQVEAESTPPDEATGEPQVEEGEEEGQEGRRKRKWWWVLIGK